MKKHWFSRLGGRPRTLIAAFTGLVLLLPVSSASGAPTWSNEQAMVNSSSASARDTFVADPGRGRIWDRASLIAAHGSFYRERGFGNLLAWGELRHGYDPGASAHWAGCGGIIGQHFGDCPNGLPLHQRAVGYALGDTRITALVSGDAFLALACGNFSGTMAATAPPAISGAKFEDIDGNGQRDANEPGLSGWTIQLYQQGTLLASTMTAADGSYRFTLDADALPIHSEDFQLQEIQQNGWVASRTPATVHVPFGSAGAEMGGNDFGNYRPARIDASKYEDMEADGSRDADDPGLSDWVFDLAGPSGPRSGVSNSFGDHSFGGLRPGTYTISERLLPGWRYSSPADGTHTITVRSGEAATAAFGNYRPAKIEGLKFHDTNVSRLRDAGEPHLENWLIALSGGPSSDASTPTDDAGRYSFGGLKPGTYVISETLQPGWRQSAPATGTHTVTVRSGDTRTADFGNVCLASTQVRIFDEASGQPLAGTEVRIEEVSVVGELDNEPRLPRTTTGAPTFSDLLPGVYRIVAFLPPGVYSTDPGVTVVDGRLAVVKLVTLAACAKAEVPVAMFTTSTGKVTGGIRMPVKDGFSTAGFVFMVRGSGAEGSLEYQDHARRLNLHTRQIEQIRVRGNEAWIGGLVTIDGIERRFILHLVDNGEPGTSDRFELLVEDGYRAGYDQPITGGNVQIHRPAPR